MTWTDERKEEVRVLWGAPGMSSSKIARHLGVSRNAIIGVSRRMNLQYHGGNGISIKEDHDAATYGATIFPTKVVMPDDRLFKAGINQRKLGARVLKGRWKGFPIYSLTLEERATCPRTCRQWLNCMGNGMHNATRYAHGRALEDRIWQELTMLQRFHRKGFVIRLHVLGDFYSVDYVSLWHAALRKFPALNVFGYTAWPASSAIGYAIEDLRTQMWERFSIRTSGAVQGPRTTVIADKRAKHPDAVICPAQLSQTESCASCTLCWSSQRLVSFLRH